MHHQGKKQGSVPQSCFKCKKRFGDIVTRYYCCSKANCVCDQCAKASCKLCKTTRTVALRVGKCSATRCKKIYAQQDLFYDFQGPYFLCPQCLKKDYNFYYQKAVKDKILPKQVTLDTKHTYPYQDLVVYFKQWCFCCASRIGQEDGFEMVKGPRICHSCVSLNIHIMQLMIKCIECQGYIHTTAEIYQTYANEADVLCKYCAEKQKEHMSKQEIEALDSPRLQKKQFVSAIEKSKLKSNKSFNEPNRIILSKASKVSSVNSFEEELQNVQLSINYSHASEFCQACRCLVDKDNSLLHNRADPNNTATIMGLFGKEKKQLRMCFVCFGQQFTDRGQTIEFSSDCFRQPLRQQEQNNPAVKGVKSLAFEGASHGIFK